MPRSPGSGRTYDEPRTAPLPTVRLLPVELQGRAARNPSAVAAALDRNLLERTPIVPPILHTTSPGVRGLRAMIDAPFPWFGGKRKVAAEVWARFGAVENYVEPFFGSGAVLLGRPAPRPWTGAR
jgi:hypothetical protein